MPKDIASGSKIIANGRPKLIKNLGSLKDKGYNVNGSLEDKKGNILIGGDGGLCRYDGNTFTNYTEQDEKTESLY